MTHFSIGRFFFLNMDRKWLLSQLQMDKKKPRIVNTNSIQSNN